ncbi:MAG: hypothetical protein MJ061_03615 [Mailhella sp.]|nr:hypothetical protein [Mailhella sp.]
MRLDEQIADDDLRLARLLKKLNLPTQFAVACGISCGAANKSKDIADYIENTNGHITEQMLTKWCFDNKVWSIKNKLVFWYK